MSATQCTGAVIFLIGLWIWVYLIKVLFIGVIQVTKKEILRDSDGTPILNDADEVQYYETEWEYHRYKFETMDGRGLAGLMLFVGLVAWCAGWIPLFYR